MREKLQKGHISLKGYENDEMMKRKKIQKRKLNKKFVYWIDY